MKRVDSKFEEERYIGPITLNRAPMYITIINVMIFNAQGTR